jgi:hypothetical protein
MLWQADGIDPAPEPDHDTGCVFPGYDIAVFVSGDATDAEINKLGERLKADERIASIEFLTAKEAQAAFRAENPDDEGPVTNGQMAQYRVALKPDVDQHANVARELADLGDGAFRPALTCSPEEPDSTFARYFFETGSRDASASGVLEVNSQEGTLCYEATVENVMASHLLRNTGVTAGGRRFERMIAATFFEPGVGPTPSAAGNVSMCLRGEELGEMEDELQVLIDHPEDFRVDVHRGPNDDPGLVAQLLSEPVADQGLSLSAYLFRTGADIQVEFVPPEDHAWGADNALYKRVGGDFERVATLLGGPGDPRLQTRWPEDDFGITGLGNNGTGFWTWRVPGRLEPGEYELRKDSIADGPGHYKDRTTTWKARFWITRSAYRTGEQKKTRDACPYVEARPSYLPWLEQDEDLPEPRREIQNGTSYVLWSTKANNPSRQRSVVLRRNAEARGGRGEPVTVRLEGAPGFYYDGPMGQAAVLWQTGSGRCSLITLSVSLPGADRAELRRETLRVADSLEN